METTPTLPEQPTQPTPLPVQGTTLEQEMQQTTKIVEKGQISSSPIAIPVPLATSPKQGTSTVKKTPVKGKKLGAGFFLGCFGLFAFLFVLFVVVAVVAMNVNPNNSFLPGVKPGDMKNIISGLVGISFGILSLLLLIVLVINVFRKIITKKEEKDKRRKSIIGMVISSVILILVVTIWIFINGSLDRIKVSGDSQLLGSIVASNVSTGEKIDTLQLTAPIDVQFSAENITKLVKQTVPTAQILSYEWDLDGDGEYKENKTEEKVTWHYASKGKNSGMYEIKMRLTIRDKDGKIQTQEFKKDLSIATVLPDAVITVDQEQGESPLTVVFDASGSSDPDGQNPKDIKIVWSFNNDNKFDGGESVKITHVFDKIGTYPVMLRVTNASGKFTVITKTITVTGIRQDTPIANILANPMSGKAPLQVTFSAENSTSPNGNIVHYEWNYGDGPFSDKTLSGAHTFQKPGKYTVQLKVRDGKDKEAMATVEIVVEGSSSAPAIVITTTPAYTMEQGTKVVEGNAPLTIQFDASKTTDKENDVIDYLWDLDGDGTYETHGAKPDAKIYYQEGQKNISVKVQDSAGNESAETIIVRPLSKPLQAVIKASPLSGASPLTVSFDASASRYTNGTIERYQWDFNDGTPPKIYQGNIQYTFQKPGVYHVKLTVLTGDGQQASTKQDIFVSEIPLVAQFKPSINKGKSPLSITFDPGSSTGNIVSYQWDFGDGNNSTERKPTHEFVTPGTYTVVLKVQSKDNITDYFSVPIDVQ